MAKTPLKNLATPAQPVALSVASERPDAGVLRQVAADAGRVLPPAVVRPSRKTVLINVKVDEGLAVALAQRAQTEGVTQKQIIVRALAAAGLPVDPADLEDRTPRRRVA